MKKNAKIALFLGKFAEVSDPTVGVDFFARLVQVKYIFPTPFYLYLASLPHIKRKYNGKMR